MARYRGIELRSAELLDSLMSDRYTNRSLAEAVGCSHQMIGLLRSGKQTSCKRCLADRIADALGVSTDALFNTDTDHTADPQDHIASEMSV